MAGDREYCIVEKRWLAPGEYDDTPRGLVHRHLPGHPNFRAHYLKTGKWVDDTEIENVDIAIAREGEPPPG